MIQNKKVLLLYSGGLDSRIVAKVLQEHNNKVEAIFFNHPFNSDESIRDNFLDKNNIALHEINCYEPPWLSRFLEMITTAEHGYGKGYNPCIDCKIFYKKVAQQYAQENDLDCLATGEVPGQRPMSQTEKALTIMKKEISIQVAKPLADIGVTGRSRQKQIELAKKYGIEDYPSPAGGCLLADTQLKKKFQALLENSLINPETVSLLNIGRHFYFEQNKEWYVVGRNEEECEVIDEYENVIESGPGKPGVFYRAEKITDSVKQKALELQKAYKKHEDKQLYQKYQEWKL